MWHLFLDCEWVDDLCQAVAVTIDAGSSYGGDSNGGAEIPQTLIQTLLDAAWAAVTMLD